MRLLMGLIKSLLERLQKRLLITLPMMVPYEYRGRRTPSFSSLLGNPVKKSDVYMPQVLAFVPLVPRRQSPPPQARATGGEDDGVLLSSVIGCDDWGDENDGGARMTG